MVVKFRLVHRKCVDELYIAHGYEHEYKLQARYFGHDLQEIGWFDCFCEYGKPQLNQVTFVMHEKKAALNELERARRTFSHNDDNWIEVEE